MVKDSEIVQNHKNNRVKKKQFSTKLENNLNLMKYIRKKKVEKLIQKRHSVLHRNPKALRDIQNAPKHPKCFAGIAE